MVRARSAVGVSPVPPRLGSPIIDHQSLTISSGQVTPEDSPARRDPTTVRLLRPTSGISAFVYYDIRPALISPRLFLQAQGGSHDTASVYINVN